MSTASAGYHKWIASAVIVALVSYGLISNRRLISGMFGDGATSGKIAKLEYRLQESFYPSSVAWSPDGRYIAVGSTMSSRIDIWDLSRRKIIETLHRKFPPASFHDIAWSPNGQYVTFCDAPGVLRVYSTHSWTEIHALGGPPGNGGCTQSAFSSDSSQLALLGTNLLQVASTADWQTIKSLNLGFGWGRGDPFNTITYLPNSHVVLVGGGQYVPISIHGHKLSSWDGRVWFLGPADEVPSREIRAYRAAGDNGGGGDIRSLTSSPNGRYIVTGVNTGAGDAGFGGIAVESVHILRVLDGQLIATPLDNADPRKFGRPEAIAYTHDGRYIMVPHDVAEGWIHILDGRTFGVIEVVRSGAFAFDVAVNQVNDEFAVGSGKQVIVWSLPN